MGSKIESGLQLFSRLNYRPSVENLSPVLFNEGGPFPNEFVEITGSSGSGKTLLVMDLLARCLLPLEYNGVDLPGKNCGAIIINTDHHFDMFKLISIMECILRKHCDKSIKLSQSNLEGVIKSCLKNLVVLNCYDSQQLQMTFHNLEHILSENSNVGLVAIDSISSYYWEYRNNNGIVSLQSYHSKMFASLQSSTKNSNVVVIFTKPEVEVKTTKDKYAQHITYKVILNECEQKFQALIINKNAQSIIPYVIEKTIVFVGD